MGNNHKGTVQYLTERTDNLEKEVKSVTSKQLSTIQDITRNTGRLNKVELDIKKINDDVAEVQEQNSKIENKSEKQLKNTNKLAGKKFAKEFFFEIDITKIRKG